MVDWWRGTVHFCKYKTVVVRGRGGGEESESISNVGFTYEVSYNGRHSTGSKGKMIERRASIYRTSWYCSLKSAVCRWNRNLSPSIQWQQCYVYKISDVLGEIKILW